MGLKRMDNVGIVADDLVATIEYFSELGLELEGRAMIEGEWAGRVTGLGDQRVESAMMRTPDGHSRLELSRFLAPPVVADHRNAPVNALGYLRVMFAVDDIDETLARLRRDTPARMRLAWLPSVARIVSASVKTSAALAAGTRITPSSSAKTRSSRPTVQSPTVAASNASFERRSRRCGPVGIDPRLK